jgi:predicted acylesterase/phospholipase RssA
MDVNPTNWDIDFTCDNEKISLADFRQADSLVMSGGGMKGIYLLGAIEYLHDAVGFGHLNAYYGVSIGAVICSLLLVGYAPIEIMAQICVNKIQQKISVIDKHVIDRKSLFNPHIFVGLFEEMITTRYGSVPTLKELYEKTGKDLYITTVCLSTPMTPVYLHHSTHPDLPLSIATQMSMSIPFLFGYTVYEDKKYMDGGFLDNFPICYASKSSKRPFGISLQAPMSSDEGSFLSEVFFVMTLPISYITEVNKRNCPPNACFIEIDTGEDILSTVSFDRKNDAVYEMFAKGYHECRTRLTLKEKRD